MLQPESDGLEFDTGMRVMIGTLMRCLVMTALSSRANFTFQPVMLKNVLSATAKHFLATATLIRTKSRTNWFWFCHKVVSSLRTSGRASHLR